MTDDKNKQYKTEWSFSFEKLGDQIGEFARSMGVQGEEAIKHDIFTAPLSGVSATTVRIDLSVGEHTVRALAADSINLIEADLTYVGEIAFSDTGDAERKVTLSQASSPGSWVRGMMGWMGSRRLKWDVALTTKIPLTLDVRGGVGETTLDLAALQTRQLHLSMGTGKVNAILPGAQTYSAKIDAGIGEFTLRVPDNTEITLEVTAGTGEVTIELGAGCRGSVAIDGGVGEFNLKLPQGAAIRVEGSTSIGGIHIQGHGLQKVRGGDEFI
ncbi:MAG: hypothetical protein SGJ24_05595, partial [Chloroflexota bacterium]|nr:hypothetical protein [Chloroflexota bacterium]